MPRKQRKMITWVAIAACALASCGTPIQSRLTESDEKVDPVSFRIAAWGLTPSDHDRVEWLTDHSEKSFAYIGKPKPRGDILKVVRERVAFHEEL